MATHLIDTSAYARMQYEAVSDVLAPLIEAGVVGSCAPLDFEDLYQTRTPAEYRLVTSIRRNAYEHLLVAEDEWSRAFEVQTVLASQSRLRGVGMSDLLIAAVAERNGLTLLHYDGDFDTIAEITGQDARWVVPRGQTP
ncbi:PIN domain nuclease [Parafrigoribacterium soli]|uniref:PIN domain nuclease n=1 Tax=Parafrigoribacterium soli TaxID=3144663 RepID=UPI0032F09836